MPLAPETLAALFEASPNPYIVLAPDLTVAGANDAYLDATRKRPEDLIGRHLFDAFPGSPQSQALLRESFAHVLEHKTPHAVSFMRFDIPLPGGGFEERYWSTHHAPVFDEAGNVTYILHHVVDVTELQRLRAHAGGEGFREGAVLEKAREMQKQNTALAAQTRRLRNLFQQAPGFMAIVTTPDYVFEFVNDSFVKLIGDRPYTGAKAFDVVPESEGQGFRELLDRVCDTGQAVAATAMPLRVKRAPRAPLETLYLSFVFQPILEEDGSVSGIFVEGFDVSDLKRTEDALRANEKHLRLMVAELNHRVKNTIAIILSIAARTNRQSNSFGEFFDKYQNRLIALSRTHDTLTDAFWESARLHDIVLCEMRAFDESRVRLDGPDAALSPETAVAVGLCIHELASNAAKYGALSNDSGHIAISCRAEDGTIALTWEERGGPPVTAPTRRGFGSELIGRSFPGACASKLEFPVTGVLCQLRVPVAPARSADTPSAGSSFRIGTGLSS